MPLALQAPLLAIRRLTPVGASICAYVFFVTVILSSCHWIYASAAGIMGLSYYAIALVSACMKASPYAIAGGLSCVVWARFPRTWPTATAGLFACAEWVQMAGPNGFPFGAVSLSQVDGLMAQLLLPIFGSLGLSAFTVGISCMLNLSITNRRWVIAAAAVSLLIAPTAIHVPVTRQSGGRAMRVALVQARVTKTLLHLTESAALHKPALIVWPEDAIYTHDPSVAEVSLQRARVLAHRENLTLLIGVSSPSTGLTFSNRLVEVHPDGSNDIYVKQQLVPFAEFVPYRAAFERIFPILTQLHDLQRGQATRDFTVAGSPLTIRPLLCYEGMFPTFVKSLQRNEIVVVSTDDSWFHDVSGPLQQIDGMRMRAAETGHPIVVDGTTGPSGIIDSRGFWHPVLSIGNIGEATVDVPVSIETPYGRFGSSLLTGSLLVLFLFSALSNRRLDYKRKGYASEEAW